MDIITVQTIIAMLDRQIDMINGYALHNKGGLTETEAISAIAGRNTLNQLKDHLQSFIEAELNAEENKTVE